MASEAPRSGIVMATGLREFYLATGSGALSQIPYTREEFDDRFFEYYALVFSPKTVMNIGDVVYAINYLGRLYKFYWIDP